MQLKKNAEKKKILLLPGLVCYDFQIDNWFLLIKRENSAVSSSNHFINITIPQKNGRYKGCNDSRICTVLYVRSSIHRKTSKPKEKNLHCRQENTLPYHPAN